MDASGASSVDHQFDLALRHFRQRYGRIFQQQGFESLAVAYSGGLDSSVLLRVACRFAAEEGIACYALHVHHGLSPNADQWLEHCRQQAHLQNAKFLASRVSLAGSDKSSVEEAARIKRYQALGHLCRDNGIPLLLTAHHLDDQAETVLMQLLRGSGVAGLSGMSEVNSAPNLVGGEVPIIARPLLGVSRAELELYAAQHEVGHVEDESNLDRRYVRNALRHAVMPILASQFPGYAARLARSAQHAQSAQSVLAEVAEADLAACLEGEALQVERLRSLSPPRIDNLLRYWLSKRGFRMPSTAWLQEAVKQIFDAKPDARLCVGHPECDIHRYRGRVFITSKIPHLEPDEIVDLAQRFKWQGEARIDFPSYGGALLFAQAEQGFDADWLKAQNLALRYRQGGERLKPAFDRPTRSLKQHYQALAVPAWERERLPVLAAGSELLFAAGIGMDCRNFANGTAPKVQVQWEPEKAQTEAA